MNYRYLLLAPVLMLALACSTVAKDASEEQPAEPQPPGITIVDPGTDIGEIRSDPFELGEVSIQGDTLTMEVSYEGSGKGHSFKLYWDGLTLESYPPQIHLTLKHDAGGDKGQTSTQQTLVFKLHEDIAQPTVIHLGTDHGGHATIRYGKRGE